MNDESPGRKPRAFCDIASLARGALFAVPCECTHFSSTYCKRGYLMAKATPATPLAIPSGPKASVPKDPQPSVDRIEDLARRILNADILLPKFQRDFVWDKPQVLQLWDSVARGYPIGSILLWQSRQELRSQNQIADLPINLPKPDYPVNYLLDGQQRLSSICGAMYWMRTDPTSPWNIAYDLREDRFKHLDTLDDPALHIIRVNKLADPSLYFQHVYGLDGLAAHDKELLKKRTQIFSIDSKTTKLLP